MAGNTELTGENEIRQLVTDWVRAIHEKDLRRLTAMYTTDVLVYDLAPPLQYLGMEAYRKNMEEWFASFRGPIGYEIRDLRIAAAGDVAYSHSLNRISGARTGGEETDVWVRATVGYRKIGERWKIVHEHFSTPFEMAPPFKASLNLKP